LAGPLSKLNLGDAPPTAEERAYAYIRGEIMNGAYRPGDKLAEEAVARQIGVSRTPVRGALHRLTTEGLVEFRSYVGAVVRVMPDAEIDQLFQVRAVLESMAAETAATTATEADIAVLEQLCQSMDAIVASETPDPEELARLNKAFHGTLMCASGNIVACRVAENLGDLNVMVRSYRRFSRAALQLSMGHHRELVLALKARNPGWARTVMAAHIEAARSSCRDPEIDR
jgi:DNA-binding GntR family transcriptional regulator